MAVHAEGQPARPAQGGCDFVADPRARSQPEHSTMDVDHGRIEVRRHVVSHDIGWMLSDRCHPAEATLPGLGMIGMVEATVTRDGRTSTERRYYLSVLCAHGQPMAGDRLGCTGCAIPGRLPSVEPTGHGRHLLRADGQAGLAAPCPPLPPGGAARPEQACGIFVLSALLTAARLRRLLTFAPALGRV